MEIGCVQTRPTSVSISYVSASSPLGYPSLLLLEGLEKFCLENLDRSFCFVSVLVATQMDIFIQLLFHILHVTNYNQQPLLFIQSYKA